MYFFSEEDQANNAMKYLISEGIDKKRIFISGKGSFFPIQSNITPEGRKRNNRIEVKILEKR